PMHLEAVNGQWELSVADDMEFCCPLCYEEIMVQELEKRGVPRHLTDPNGLLQTAQRLARVEGEAYGLKMDYLSILKRALDTGGDEGIGGAEAAGDLLEFLLQTGDIEDRECERVS
ncbi:MAG: hypothetical protein ACOC58_05550, partial [Chloroflexota bacterium]